MSRNGKILINHIYSLLLVLTCISASLVARENISLIEQEIASGKTADILTYQKQRRLNADIATGKVLRHRFVTISPQLTAAADFQGKNLALALFSDVNFLSDTISSKRHSAKEMTLQANLKSQPGSLVINLHNGVLNGVVRTASALYRIEPAAEDVYLVKEIAMSALAGECDARIVEGLPKGVIEKTRAGQSANDSSTIDIMVVYTPAAALTAPDIDSEIRLAISELNMTFALSGVRHRARLVYSSEVNYTESGDLNTDLDRIKEYGDGHMDVVHVMRDVFGADVVSLWTNGGGNGAGYVMQTPDPSFESLAFHAIRWDNAVNNFTFAHELGHNLGAAHDRENAVIAGSASYAHGYQDPAGSWRTIMAYSDGCSCSRISYWSNPEKFHPGDGSLMGVASSDSLGADNRRVLNQNGSIVAAFRSGATIPFLAVSPENAQMAHIAGSKNLAVQNIGAGSMNWSAVVTSGGEWLTISAGASGADSGNIVMDFPENTAYTPRTAAVSINAPGVANSPQTIYVTQHGVIDYATLPYTNGFESGTWENCWRTDSDHPNGDIAIDGEINPFAGNYSLKMAASVIGPMVTNDARLHLNLAGEKNVILEFQWMHSNEETHLKDGVFFSDDAGESFQLVQDFQSLSYPANNWIPFSLNVDSLAIVHGLTLSEHFVVKFQQYDNFPFGSDGFAIDDIAVYSKSLLVDAQVWLSGAYKAAGDSMSTTLAAKSVLPLNQPYGDPSWGYNGSEAVSEIPADIVDWVLLELRSSPAPESIVTRRAGLLRKDGRVVDLDGESPLCFNADAGNYYLVVYHYNHLPVMSSSSLILSAATAVLADLSSDTASAYGTNALQLLETGVYGMITGDANGDGIVNVDDREDVWRSENGIPWEYFNNADFNLDGGVDALDINIHWRSALGMQRQVP